MSEIAATNTNEIKPLSFRDLLRAPVTSRWHTVPTLRSQDLASHSHQVGMIAEAILMEFNPAATFQEKYLVLKYAQLHDLPEIFMGDMPTPMKKYLKSELPGFATALKSMEEALVPELVLIQEQMNEFPHLAVICKSADLIEAIHFFSLFHSVDEKQKNAVLKKLQNQLYQEKIKARQHLSSQALANAIQRVLESACDIERGTID